MSQDIEARMAIEKQIAERLVAELLDHNFWLAVFDGEEITPANNIATDICVNLEGLEEVTLRVYRKFEPAPGVNTYQYYGEILLVYGNDGYDLIADNSVSLNEYITATEELASQIEESLYAD